MSYEPLHHKYRPQTFAELVGQDAIAQTLRNAIAKGRIAPAYLFTGPRGTGKTSSSRILAKSLNCLESETPTDQPCGQCEVCRQITRGNAMDVIEIDAASNTGVDNIREIIEKAQFAPVQCRYKVYVIDECHMLSVPAFNALLKTLEEPPNRVVFVLATTDPQRVLNTIISRCQRFDFRRIPLEAMVQHLTEIAQKEAIEINNDALTLVAQIANGGLRDAESLLDQLSLQSGEITVDKVWDLVGAVPERDLLTLLQAIRGNDPEKVISQCRHLLDQGREPLIVLQNLAAFYLNLLIAKTSPQRSDLVAVTAPTWEALCEEAKSWETSLILQGQKILKESEVQLKNTTQPRLWLEVTLLGLLPQTLTPQAPPTPSPTVQPPKQQKPPVQPQHPPKPAPSPQPEPPKQQEQPKQTPPPTQPKPPQPAATQSNEEVLQRRVQASWQQVLDAINPPSTRSLVQQQCTLVDFDVDDGIAYIGVASKPLLKMAEGKVKHIEAAFEKIWHQKIKVKLQVDPGKKKSPSPKPASSSPKNGSRLTQSQRTEPPPVAKQPVSPPPPPKPTPPVSPTPPPETNGHHNVAETKTNPPVEEDITSEPVPAEEESLSEESQTENEVQQIAKKFAEFFEGEVIDLDIS
ncbi:MAG: DNA polymerase III subunit gamma/tau [Kamptonema sp. SIO4C4]|nr:DNA polymerase III subunit gamma/tau [Kamptonema sp. SIO4C4]